MPTFNIRLAKRSDIDQIYEVFSAADALHRAAHPEIFQKATYSNTIKEYYKTCIADPSMVIFVAEADQVIGGAIICTLRTTPDNPILVTRKYGLIENIAVQTQFRRQKIGQILIEQAHEWARSMGAGLIELTVWDFNEQAKDFYRKMGYTTKHIRMSRDLT